MTKDINCIDIRSLDTTALDYASCRGHISSYSTPLHHEHITWSSHGNHGILSYYNHLPTCFKTFQAKVKRPSSSPSQKTSHIRFHRSTMVFPMLFFFSSINPTPGGVFIISLQLQGAHPKSLVFHSVGSAECMTHRCHWSRCHWSCQWLYYLTFFVFRVEHGPSWQQGWWEWSEPLVEWISLIINDRYHII